ncbi:MauE/DoxX family redox-associated membrane protein [Anoxybacteroides tepidamans]|uniref:MauE/DoxX family redox-associated membrane protein n=1 Tax=Anoxybacteroides tepidamans TaxID=265948 RepID=UPI003964825A
MFADFLLTLILLVFLYSLISKIIHKSKYKHILRNYGIKNNNLIKIVYFFIVLSEGFITISLFLSGVTIYSLVTISLLLTIFSVFVLINLFKGNKNFSCGCGGILENERLSYWMVLRNVVIILIALIFFKTKHSVNYLTVQNLVLFFIGNIFLIYIQILKELKKINEIMRFIFKYI